MKPRLCDRLLALSGIAGLMLYVLACRPSFSPDGTKVVFSVNEEESSRTSIVVYDIKEKAFETLAQFSGEIEGDAGGRGAYAPQWLSQGQQVLINGKSMIMVLPAGGHGPVRTLMLRRTSDDGWVLPPPVVGDDQFLVSEEENRDLSSPKKHVLRRVNLRTWEIRDFPLRFNCDLYGNGSELLYAAEIEKEKKIEIGRLDTRNGVLSMLIQFETNQDQEFAFIGPGHSRDRFALSAFFHGESRIYIIRGNSVEKIIPVASKAGQTRIGNLEWSVDERSLYTNYTATPEQGGETQFGVMEVRIDSGGVREMPLFNKTVNDDSRGAVLFYFPLALSPDGGKIAVSTGNLGTDVTPPELALYLLNIATQEWKVTRVPVPLASARPK